MLGVCLLMTFPALADDQVTETLETTEESGEAERGPRHRLDLTIAFLDTVEIDTASALLSYTYNVTPRSNLTFVVPYLDPDVSSGGNSGFGDLGIAWSYVPFLSISANPWIPRTVGSGIGVIIPTGDPDDGRSLGAVIVNPFLGLVVPLSKTFFLAPTLGYAHSLAQTNADTDVRQTSLELAVSYVSLKGLWVNYTAEVIRDLESSETSLNHRLAIGKQFKSGFGLSVDLVKVEQVDFDTDTPIPGSFDDRLELTGHFTF